METLEALSARIDTTRNLQSIVRTMKTLAAVSIRQYDNAVAALREYNRAIELGMQVVLRAGLPRAPEARDADGGTIAVVFGSDHGLCGRFNEQVARFAQAELRRAAAPERKLLAVGARAAANLEAIGEAVDASLFLPGVVGGLTGIAHNVLLTIDHWQGQGSFGRILVVNNARRDGAAAPAALQLLPLDRRWLSQLAERPWRSRALPTFTMELEAVLAALVRQHLFVGIFRAGAESLASEHATRLAAMQAAERNIEDSLEELSATYRRVRQQSITEELLDVVAGFEALTTRDRTPT